MGVLGLDFEKADEGVVADLNKFTYVRGPYRNAEPLAGPYTNAPRQEDRRFISYDLRRNTLGGWDFVSNTRDVLDRILSTKVHACHEHFQEAYMDLVEFLQKEKTPVRFIGRVLQDGTFNQRGLGNTEGEVSLPAVRQALKSEPNPVMH